MKTWKVVILLCWLAFVGGMFAGCDQVYMPADMAIQMDDRIDQLQIDIEDASGPCKKYLQQDLDMMLKLRGAAQ
jgi:hypothetical protein